MEQDWFESERPWLAQQPRMADWKAGSRGLVARLSVWVADYTRRLCAAIVAESDPKQPGYCWRLWRCWAHHWRAAIKEAAGAAVDGETVAAALKAQRTPDGRTLSGDPLADVVLAEAVTLGDQRAWAIFEERFRSFCRAQAIRFIADVERADPDWWSDLMTHLCISVPAGATAGPFESRGALARFEGQSVLEPWLKSVARNFFCDRMRQAASGPKSVEPQKLEGLSRSAVPAPPADVAELEQLIRERVRAAIAELTPTEELLVRSGPGRTTTNRQAAAMLGLSEGQTSRRRQEALARFLPALRTRFPEPEYAALIEPLIEQFDRWLEPREGRS